MIERVKEVIKTFKNMNKETIEAWKYTIIAFLVIDLFGIYYYLGLKKLGIALMMVLTTFFAVFLILEQSKFKEDKQMCEENEKPTKEVLDEVLGNEESDDVFEFKMPTAESVQDGLDMI